MIPELYGDNAKAYASREPEILLCGSAGTGKSLAMLAKIRRICEGCPGARCLIVRRTRESLTESILVTWERDILSQGKIGRSILAKNPTLRRVRQSYRFPNGSEVVVGGMDKPDKVLSSEWDLIYIPEVTDFKSPVEWETLGGRLRAGRVPFQQIAADCNPTTPHFFLYKRCLEGGAKLYTSTHRDNPRYFNRTSQTWTPAGEQYLARLERMTGARRDRFLKGLWVAAEGVVYAYDAAIHLKPASWKPDPLWKRVWAIDWGKTSPTVLGMWAVDSASRMYGYRELYQTRLRPDQLGKWAKDQLDCGNEPQPVVIVCDHDEERKTDFEKASGLSVELADKRDRDKGIEAMQSRFDVADDGLPRVFFRENARETLRGKEPDRFLVDAGKPTSCIEEIVGYVWDEDYLEDTPIADNDHAMDEMRYAQRWIASNLCPGSDIRPTGFDRPKFDLPTRSPLGMGTRSPTGKR